MKISQLNGDAYYNAVSNVIQAVNDIIGADVFRSWVQADMVTSALGVDFDEDGEIIGGHTW